MRDATRSVVGSNLQRALSNNSVAYKEEKPEVGAVEEWISLYKSKSGERGIFNRDSAQKQVTRANDFRKELGDEYRLRDESYDFGTNPCSEIILRDREFCNLTEVVIV